MIASLALLALLAAAATPALGSLLGRRALDAAASVLAGEIARIRQEAIARRRYVGIALEVGAGEGRWAVHIDGGRNGIRTAEIASGSDPRLRGPFEITSDFDGVRLGIPATHGPVPAVPPSRGVLMPGDDPVQFGAADIISFSPRGESSSGTLYLTDRRGGLRAIVVQGRTGRIRVWRFVPESRAWTR